MLTNEKALYQVKLILDCLPKEEYDTIPKELVNYVENNWKYDPSISINPSVPLEEQNNDAKTYDFLEQILKQMDSSKSATITPTTATSTNTTHSAKNAVASSLYTPIKFDAITADTSTSPSGTTYNSTVASTPSLDATSYTSTVVSTPSESYAGVSEEPVGVTGHSDYHYYYYDNNVPFTKSSFEHIEIENQNMSTEIERLKKIIDSNQAKLNKVTETEEVLTSFQKIITEKEEVITKLADDNQQLVDYINGVPTWVRKVFMKDVNAKLGKGREY